MQKSLSLNLGLIALTAVLVSGCAAGKNYQSDVDAMNSRVASLQSQLDAKNHELTSLQDQYRSMMSQNKSLQDQISSLNAQLDAANRAKADAEARLYSAMDKLSKSGGSGTSSKSSSYIK